MVVFNHDPFQPEGLCKSVAKGYAQTLKLRRLVCANPACIKDCLEQPELLIKYVVTSPRLRYEVIPNPLPLCLDAFHIGCGSEQFDALVHAQSNVTVERPPNATYRAPACTCEAMGTRVH